MKRNPAHLLSVARNLAFAALGVPLEKGATFEEIFFGLNATLADESAAIGRIMDDISDQEIVYQKGEGAEAVLSRDPLVPRRGFARMAKYFIARRVELIREHAPDLANASLLDVGATSDLIFRYLDKRGIGLNISAPAVEQMRAQGIEAHLGNAEALPFEDKSLDYSLCFETIEHLENPLRCLRELARVTRKRTMISIPYTRRTQVCPFEPGDRGQHRWHFIEFSADDFERVVRRAGFRVVGRQRIIPVGRPRNLRQWLFQRRWRHDSWFRGFLFLVLEPVPD